LPAERQVNAACEPFELAWKAGRRPRIEDYLGDTPEPERSALVRELIALDTYYRRQAGEDPRPEEYRVRFPGLDLPTQSSTQADLAGEEPAPPPADARPLPAIPGYEILQELGRGGMGVVYKARQLKANRVVALKMIRAPVHASLEHKVRFKIEAELCARLQHPNIVQIHDVDENEELPFFSLEFCPGGPLNERLQGRPLPWRKAGELAETLARAVQHAHSRGVVHRDLKPANVLLTAEGEPKIADFGLAKWLDADSEISRQGQILGTPCYMSPEQASGEVNNIGPATDVYALGAILYEFLTGRPPFKGATEEKTLEQVRTQEPVAPRRLQPKVPRDLEIICLKCLQKESARRYASAGELADRLRMFLDGKPIPDRAVSLPERIGKWAKRRPALAALAGVSIAATVGLLVLVVAVLQKSETIQVLSGQIQAKKEQLALLDEAKEDVERNLRGKEEDLRRTGDIVREKEEALRRTVHIVRGNDAWDAYARSDIGTVRRLFQLQEPPEGKEDFRSFDHYLLVGLCGGERRRFAEPGGSPVCLAFSPDGKSAAWGSNYGPGKREVLIWSADTDTPIRIRFKGTLINCLTYHPKKPILAIGTHRGITFRDTNTGLEKQLLDGPVDKTGVISAAFAPDGDKLAFVTQKTKVKLWDLYPARERSELDPRSLYPPRVAFSPNGLLLAASGGERRGERRSGSVTIWKLDGPESEKPQILSETVPFLCLAFSPDNLRLAAGGDGPDGTVYVWQLSPGGGKPSVFKGEQRGKVQSITFLADSQTVASAGEDGTVVFWDAGVGKPLTVWKKHEKEVTAIALSPDRKTLGTASADGTVKLWDVSEGPDRSRFQATKGKIKTVAFIDDGKTLAVLEAYDTKITLWDVASRKQVGALPHAGQVTKFAVSANGRMLAAFGVQTATLTVWDVSERKPEHLLDGQRVACLAFSPDGRRLVLGRSDGKVTLRGPEGAGLTRTAGTQMISAICFASAGALIAAASHIPKGDKEVGVVYLWEATGGKPPDELRGHMDPVKLLACSSDGKILASVDLGGNVLLWDLAGRKRRHQLGYAGPVKSIAFSPDGKILAAAGNSVRLWDITTGNRRATLEIPGAEFTCVAFSPDGKTLAAGCQDGTVKLWEAAADTRLLP
jgi:WD40 repeat protein/tRNA A-37 threonylcarbamoyl transferase component Bud32